MAKKNDPLSPEFVKEGTDKKETKEKDILEYPDVSFFSLFRYGTVLDKCLMFIGVISISVAAVCQPLNMLVFGDITGQLVEFTHIPKSFAADEKLSENIITYVIYTCTLGVVTFLSIYISSTIFNLTAIRQSFRIRILYFEKVLNQDIGWYDKHHAGDFASRMSDDLLKLEEGIGEKITVFLFYIVAFFACLIMSFLKGWELTLICMISLPVTIISMTFISVLTSRFAKTEMDAYGAAGTIAEEVFSIIHTVLAFGGQEKESQRYEKHLTTARDNNIKRSLLNGIGVGLLWFTVYASYALAFWYGVGLIIFEDTEYADPNDRTYTPATLVTVFFCVITGNMALAHSSVYIEVFGAARGAAAKIYGIIDSIPKIHSSKGKGVQPEKIEGSIKFEDITFHYPSRPDVPILKGFNLEITAGQTVALVGSSGCGKSTCIQLIQRFYDPDVGTVYVDGHDITILDLAVLRSNIGVVGQEPVLFATTIAENIRYGSKWATMEQIENAAKKSNAHKFISSLPDGYNTIVGERGAQLSGGQKQRIAIARALVRNPKILLLDEATSALDTKSEAKVQAALDNASKECTTIIIAHRLSTIRGANRIVVVKDGQAVEDGTHEELMALNKEYHNLVTNQLSNVDHEDVPNVTLVGPDYEEDDITVHPSEHQETALEKEKDKDVSLLKIVALNKPETLQIIFGIINSVIMGASMPLFGILFGDIVQVLSGTDNNKIRTDTDFYCLIFIILGVVTGLATFLQNYMFGLAGEKMVLRVRSKMFRAMMRQEIGWYDRKENGVGALCASLSHQAANIQGATGQRIGTIFQALSTLFIAVGLFMYYEWRLGLVTMCFMPVILASVFFQKRMINTESKEGQKGMESSIKLAVEAVSNIRTVASLGNEATFHGKFIEELIPSHKKAKQTTHIRGFVLALSRSIIFFAYATCMYYGGYLMRTENLQMNSVLKVSQTLIMGTTTIASALAFTPNFQKGLQAAASIFKLLERVPQINDPVDPVPRENTTGDITFSGIEFKYPSRPHMKILHDLNMVIKRGQTIALVGPSGCGKSTIIQLIERFYDPTEGTVTIMSKDVKSMRLADLRSHLGIVSQEPNLFDRTILENIQYGDNSREVTEAEAIATAKQANIHNFIVSLPKGYDTPLGDKGTQLSGGQKQRVAIARALVRNPQILLLDEATSALDTESEKVVQVALDKAKESRTCITIAHRLSTIQTADVICVIYEGKVHELGTHSELLALKGIYYQLYSLQNGKR